MQRTGRWTSPTPRPAIIRRRAIKCRAGSAPPAGRNMEGAGRNNQIDTPIGRQLTRLEVPDMQGRNRQAEAQTDANRDLQGWRPRVLPWRSSIIHERQQSSIDQQARCLPLTATPTMVAGKAASRTVNEVRRTLQGNPITCDADILRSAIAIGETRRRVQSTIATLLVVVVPPVWLAPPLQSPDG